MYSEEILRNKKKASEEQNSKASKHEGIKYVCDKCSKKYTYMVV